MIDGNILAGLSSLEMSVKVVIEFFQSQGGHYTYPSLARPFVFPILAHYDKAFKSCMRHVTVAQLRLASSGGCQ
jgi:hypothetical protein